MSIESATFKYEAFISYRHAEPDKQWAKWLHRRLETYKTPKQLVKQMGLPPKIGRVFRDEEELSASTSLSQEIVDALTHSKFLVVICSPRTRESLWIDEEIRLFRNMRPENILALLVEGEPRDSFPASLFDIHDSVRQIGSDGIRIESQPLAADVRRNHRADREVAFFKLAAPILGCSYDSLRRREQDRKLKRLTWLAVTAGFVATLLLLALIRVNKLRVAAKTSAVAAETSAALAEKRRIDAEYTLAIDKLNQGDAPGAVSLLAGILRDTKSQNVPGEARLLYSYWQPRIEPFNEALRAVSYPRVIKWRDRYYYLANQTLSYLTASEVVWSALDSSQDYLLTFEDHNRFAVRILPSLNAVGTFEAPTTSTTCQSGTKTEERPSLTDFEFPYEGVQTTGNGEWTIEGIANVQPYFPNFGEEFARTGLILSLNVHTGTLKSQDSCSDPFRSKKHWVASDVINIEYPALRDEIQMWSAVATYFTAKDEWYHPADVELTDREKRILGGGRNVAVRYRIGDHTYLIDTSPGQVGTSYSFFSIPDNQREQPQRAELAYASLDESEHNEYQGDQLDPFYFDRDFVVVLVPEHDHSVQCIDLKSFKTIKFDGIHSSVKNTSEITISGDENTIALAPEEDDMLRIYKRSELSQPFSIKRRIEIQSPRMIRFVDNLLVVLEASKVTAFDDSGLRVWVRELNTKEPLKGMATDLRSKVLLVFTDHHARLLSMLTGNPLNQDVDMTKFAGTRSGRQLANGASTKAIRLTIEAASVTNGLAAVRLGPTQWIECKLPLSKDETLPSIMADEAVISGLQTPHFTIINR
jgi:hypothetical protein